MGMGKRAKAFVASAVLASTALFTAAPGWAQELVGQPTPGGIGLQPSASPLKVEATLFHNTSRSPVVGIRLTTAGDSGDFNFVGTGLVQWSPPSSEKL